MTHTVHPFAHRLGILRDWKAHWFSSDPKKYREFMRCDTALREYLNKKLRGQFVSTIDIDRGNKTLRITIKTARPGIIIGRSGEGVVKLKTDLEKIIDSLSPSERPELKVDVEEVRSPESNAAIVGQMVAEGLEKRMPFRRVLKQTVEKVMANRDVQGVRIAISGRLGGAEMSRSEETKKGRIPLQTFRADIDFARIRAYLPYGVIGVKVWIYRGDVFEDRQKKQ
jgi:small subunit ribosomal protein S3